MKLYFVHADPVQEIATEPATLDLLKGIERPKASEPRATPGSSEQRGLGIGVKWHWRFYQSVKSARRSQWGSSGAGRRYCSSSTRVGREAIRAVCGPVRRMSAPMTPGPSGRCT